MTDAELKEFGEAVKRLEEAYPGEDVGIERRWSAVRNNDGVVVSRIVSYVSHVGICDTHGFGHGGTAIEAAENLTRQVPSGEAFRRGVTESLLGQRSEIDAKLARLELAQLEAQSV